MAGTPGSSSDAARAEMAWLLEAAQSIVSDVLSRQRREMSAISTDLTPLVDHLADLMGGGKRLRPAFCYWGWRASGGGQTMEAARAATALEFLQACALIHDDVMDGSDTRRGLPAAHRLFATLHRGSQWLGSHEAFGVGAAILLGDLCLSWADEVLLTSGIAPDGLVRGKQVYDEMRTELMAGQYLDLLEQARGGGSVERAMAVVRYKSAKYTIERPLLLGAALAGATSVTVDALSAYGLPLGEAFQLRDDVLGVFGDPAETGKPAGDDLREGKQTVLIALAAERATPTQSELLRRHLGDPALGLDGIESLRDVLRDTGALADTEKLIDDLLQRSMDSLAASDVDEESRSALEGLATAATRRSV